MPYKRRNRACIHDSVLGMRNRDTAIVGVVSMPKAHGGLMHVMKKDGEKQSLLGRLFWWLYGSCLNSACRLVLF